MLSGVTIASIFITEFASTLAAVQQYSISLTCPRYRQLYNDWK